MASGVSTKAAQVPSQILGDVNNDGRVNISDALIVATYGIDQSITIPNNGDIALGDVNGDGRMNISDALIIATYGIAPSNPSLPAGIGQLIGVVISQDAVRVGSGGSPLTYRATSGNQVTFAVQGQAPPVEVGDVMVNTTEPYFLKRVTRVVSQSTGQLVVETGPAALTDVVEQATLHETFSIPGASPKALSPAGIQEFSLTLDNTTIATEGDFSLQATSGHIAFSPVYEFALEIEGGRLELFRLAAGGDLDAALALQLTANRAVASISRQKTVAEVPPAPYHVVFWAGWVPVVVGIQMEVEVGARVGVEASGTVTTEFGVTHAARLGVEYAGGRWSELRGGTPQFTATAPQIDLVGDAALRGFLDVLVNVDLYDVAGPHVGLEPYAELAATLPSSRDRIDWGLAAGLDAFVGAHIEVLDDTLVSYNKSFEWLRRSLLDGSIPLANQRPTASISAPSSGSSYTEGATITLRRSATDPEDGTLSGSSLVWTSGGDRLGTGATLSTASLSAGTHTLNLTATDSKGATSTATITLTVTAVVRRPDLLVDNLGIDPPLATTSTPLTVSVRVQNVGQASASQTLVVLRVDGTDRDQQAQDIGPGIEAWIEFDPLLLGAGNHTVEVIADPNSRLDDADRSNNRRMQTVTVSQGLAASESLVFILDLSVSMNDQTPAGATRLQVAKDALVQVLASAPATGTKEYALVTFGGDCSVSTPVPFTGDPQPLAAHTRGVSADGSTPLAEALRAAQHLALNRASSDEVKLVLLSDGQERCGGDPIAVAQAIAAGRRAKPAKVLARVIRLRAIGLGVTPGGADEQQIQAIAAAAGGNYFRVTQPQDLAAALGQASGLQPGSTGALIGKVTDQQGLAVAGAAVRLLYHPDLREQTDANGTYRFPADFQGVDSLIEEAPGYLRHATEVYVSGRSYDVQLTPSAASLPVAVARAEPASVDPGGQVTLRGAESSDPGGGTLVFHWDQSINNRFPVTFSANNSSSAFAVRVTLEDPGTYTFTLVVENPQGLRSAPGHGRGGGALPATDGDDASRHGARPGGCAGRAVLHGLEQRG